MKRLMITTAFAMTAFGAQAQEIGVAMAQFDNNFLTGQAFSRKLEKEADEKAVEYLEEAQVDPSSLMKVMELFDVYLSSDGDVSWISSHPVPADRKKYLEQKIKRIKTDPNTYKSPISSKSWTDLQGLISEYANQD